MEIYLFRNGRSEGPHSIDHVINEIKAEQIDIERDLAWVDGMGEEWKPLGFVLELYCLPSRNTPPYSLDELLSSIVEESEETNQEVALNCSESSASITEENVDNSEAQVLEKEL
ncbi:MAG: hypothetical protein AAF558_13605, partial [Verrucomicrobiota bacterium]